MKNSKLLLKKNNNIYKKINKYKKKYIKNNK